MVEMKLTNYRFRKDDALKFIDSMYDPHLGGYRSVPGGPVTLYGTCYAILTQYYLGEDVVLDSHTIDFIQNGQIETGEFVGPELRYYEASEGSMYDREHLVHHLTCAVIPVCLQFHIPIQYPLKFSHKYCDLDYLKKWLDQRDFKYAWLEGNNLIFVGQLLIYLREVEKIPEAGEALSFWFKWLDDNIDPNTSLWGSNGFCRLEHAVYGGYHQLLAYYYEDHEISNPQGLVDTILSLQHIDGGFNPKGNAGACEDVDSVDILVNMYKRFDYRRGDIRFALKRCLNHILHTQNKDGGFPYNRNKQQSHMAVPGTQAPQNVSCMFPTWFRIHTLALISEILPDAQQLNGVSFRFSKEFSMGWHKSPSGWKYNVNFQDQLDEGIARMEYNLLMLKIILRRMQKRIYRKITGNSVV